MLRHLYVILNNGLSINNIIAFGCISQQNINIFNMTTAKRRVHKKSFACVKALGKRAVNAASSDTETKTRPQQVRMQHVWIVTFQANSVKTHPPPHVKQAERSLPHTIWSLLHDRRQDINIEYIVL